MPQERSTLAWLGAPERARLLLALAVLGYLLRIGIWAVSQGSNDIRTWYYFALHISRHGLEETYVQLALFNHPPLMGLWGVAAFELCGGGSFFPMVFKLPSLAAELATGLLLYRVYRERDSVVGAWRAFAAYGLALSCILISGYHGNTDAVYFYLAFLAAHLMERRLPFWSGVALGAALNVKLIPVVLGLPLLSRCTRSGEVWRYLGGAALGAVPFLWALGTFDAPGREQFIENLFMYRSNLEFWGIEMFVRWSQFWTEGVSQDLATGIRAFGTWYSVAGGKLLLLGSAALALWHHLVSRRLPAGRTVLDAYELSTLAFAMFLVFASGFGVQYVGCVVAPLMACHLLRGTLVATTSGVFIGMAYLFFVTEWWPVFSDHQPIPASFTPVSALAWFSIAYAAFATLSDALARARETRAPSSGEGAGRPVESSSPEAPKDDPESSAHLPMG